MTIKSSIHLKLLFFIETCFLLSIKMFTFLTHLCDIMRKIALVLLVLASLSSCEGLIYLVRGPKYVGKFEPGSYPEGLDSTRFYYCVRDYGSPDAPDLYYSYLRFRNNGKLEMMSSRNELLKNDAYDSLHSIYGSGLVDSYVYKKRRGVLKWEFYSNFYNGFTLYRAKIVGDSLESWDVPFVRVKTTYNKVPD